VFAQWEANIRRMRELLELRVAEDERIRAAKARGGNAENA
jgi:hypothetical protein